jgi:hypothetical protein
LRVNKWQKWLNQWSESLLRNRTWSNRSSLRPHLWE